MAVYERKIQSRLRLAANRDHVTVYSTQTMHPPHSSNDWRDVSSIPNQHCSSGAQEEVERTIAQQYRELSAMPKYCDNMIYDGLLHRSSTASSKITYTWQKDLPIQSATDGTYSPKVYLGGVPWDITEASLHLTFKPYGLLRVEWPGRDTNSPYHSSRNNYACGYGYVHLILRSSNCVKKLLDRCTWYAKKNEWYFRLSSMRFQRKIVQVKPWVITDNNYMRVPSATFDPYMSILVGALRAEITSEGLAQVMNDLFGNVVHASIDTDIYMYPTGSGRVYFSTFSSYIKAVMAAYVKIETAKFSQTVQVDPYVPDLAICSLCQTQPGRYFCRDIDHCLNYFCRQCWRRQHSSREFL